VSDRLHALGRDAAAIEKHRELITGERVVREDVVMEKRECHLETTTH
jgi:hypothetical protein